MAFHIRHRYGGNDANPPLESLGALLDEVDGDPSDPEHAGVAVVHESGWAIGVYSGWVVTYENVDELNVAPRHLKIESDRDQVLRLMRAAAEGDLPTLDAQPWSRGYGESR
jgi:hypothetical protein